MRFDPTIRIRSGACLLAAALASAGISTRGDDTALARLTDSPLRAALVQEYRELVATGDEAAFHRRVMGRFQETTLERLLKSGDPAERRAAVAALGVVGSSDAANAALGRCLGDSDAVTRALAEGSLWSLWFRRGSAAQNEKLVEIRLRLAERDAEAALRLATRLIADAPGFAEAYNQRAIALFSLGRFAESAIDCEETIKRNPVHFGALGGLAQCQIQMGNPEAAMQTLRRIQSLRPFNTEIREAIGALERMNGDR
jgi:tetratricopeptide (TPR) repeat protein